MSASNVILIRPTGFGHDPETAGSNAFQHKATSHDVGRQAAEEFDGMLDLLRQCGIGTTVLDPIDPNAPNAVFPNNWFSTHADGRLVLYPMLTASRRAERDPDLASMLGTEGFVTTETVDLSAWEHQSRILEGTGSMVLERKKKLAFACLSPRTSESAFKDWCERFDHTPIAFTATMNGHIDADPVYHTNVVMSIGETFAVVCFDAMPYPAERQEVEEELNKAGKEVIRITIDQMDRFVGNMLELRGTKDFVHPTNGNTKNGFAYVLLSETAFNALRSDQRAAIQRHAQLIPVQVPTIEYVGGGSVRCMIAENYLPRK